MAIESRAYRGDPPGTKFPKLMHNTLCVKDPFVVLATGINKDGSTQGTVVKKSLELAFDLGQTIGWNADHFQDFYGTVELKSV